MPRPERLPELARRRGSTSGVPGSTPRPRYFAFYDDAGSIARMGLVCPAPRSAQALPRPLVIGLALTLLLAPPLLATILVLASGGQTPTAPATTSVVQPAP